MASVIKVKRSSVPGNAPTTTNLELGELAVNTFDGKLYLKKNNGTESVVEVGAGGGGAPGWTKKTANYTAVSGDKILADTSAGTFTITLPATPTAGDSVVLADGANWATNNLTVARNSQTIEGASADLTLSMFSTQVEFIYTGTTWEVYSFVTTSSIRNTSVTSAASVTPNSNVTDQYNITALAEALSVVKPSGTPVNGQKLTVRIKDSGASRALTWDTDSGGYRVVGVTLPTATIASKTVYIGCIYNSTDSYWDVVSVAQQV